MNVFAFQMFRISCMRNRETHETGQNTHTHFPNSSRFDIICRVKYAKGNISNTVLPIFHRNEIFSRKSNVAYHFVVCFYC